MKTAISLPDETFNRVSRRATDLGMSRSEFFAKAATRYLDELDASSLTSQIDEAISQAGGTDDSSRAAVDSGRDRLFKNGDNW
jgi:predicted DNA-binding protein